MLINKVGDMFLILAAGLMINFSSGCSIHDIFPFTVIENASEVKLSSLGFTTLDIITISLVLAAFVKSAQIFFHTWLADAMEGPTPVSALLHAATMVTAGVYLVVRFSLVIEHSFTAKCLLFFGSICTIFFSSAIGAAQFDLKKIIAYSTCSQLGLMFFSCSLSAYDLALFHFFNHAFFKCLLFLIAGTIIHELLGEQDIRYMGGVLRKMPFTYICFIIAVFSLIGMPFLSGAQSKDMILNLVCSKMILASDVCYIETLA